MAKRSREINKLFRGAFSTKEWEYLRNHERFSALLENDEISIDEFEQLTRIGHELLLERESVEGERTPS